MRNKNPKDTPSETSELEQRVDRMMDPHLPDEPTPAAADETGKEGPQDAAAPPPIDIFQDATTAPDVPKELLNKMKLPDKTPANPTPVPTADEPSLPDTEGDAQDDSPTPLDDEATDAAVDDITVKESDKVLEAEDAAVAAALTAKPRHSFKERLGSVFKKWWVWLLIGLAILGGLYAVPYTRYHIAGLFMKQTAMVTVLDSKTGTPVAGAEVKLAGKTAQTNKNGMVSLTVPVGHHDLGIHMQYYKAYAGDTLVPLWHSDNQTVKLVATGRQVPVKVLDKITGQPVSGAAVRVLDTKAITGKDGTAVIVLPTSSPSQTGRVQAAGYDTTTVTVQITAKQVPANTFEITPAGRVYFLSNQSGTIDVVSTNLDGSTRQTVLAGTGNEDPQDTVLMASPDWKYLALLAKRDANGQTKLSLIDTTHNNAVTTIDDSASSFQPIGWNGDYFVYVSRHTDVPDWKSNSVNLKSYNAATHKLALLDYTQAEGTSASDATFESLSTKVDFLGQRIVYDKDWYASPGYLSVPGKQDTLLMISPDGSDKKVVSKLDAASSYFGGLYQDKPDSLIVQVSPENGTTADEAFYRLAADGTYTKDTDSQVANTPLVSYPAYLLSPSGKQVFWTDERDGKNTLLTSTASGQDSHTVATLSDDYAAYGWYTDKYLLVSYKGSQLYILPAAGLSSDRQPLKVADYFTHS